MVARRSCNENLYDSLYEVCVVYSLLDVVHLHCIKAFITWIISHDWAFKTYEGCGISSIGPIICPIVSICITRYLHLIPKYIVSCGSIFFTNTTINISGKHTYAILYPVFVTISLTSPNMKLDLSRWVFKIYPIYHANDLDINTQTAHSLTIFLPIVITTQITWLDYNIFFKIVITWIGNKDVNPKQLRQC